MTQVQWVSGVLCVIKVNASNAGEHKTQVSS